MWHEPHASPAPASTPSPEDITSDQLWQRLNEVKFPSFIKVMVQMPAQDPPTSDEGITAYRNLKHEWLEFDIAEYNLVNAYKDCLTRYASTPSLKAALVLCDTARPKFKMLEMSYQRVLQAVGTLELASRGHGYDQMEEIRLSEARYVIEQYRSVFFTYPGITDADIR